jgi:rhodanese-related sulfurtransferase/DNA-binding transcriptional ArsR family regulator
MRRGSGLPARVRSGPQGLVTSIFKDYIELVTIVGEARRDFRDRLYGEFARIGKAIASPHRLVILELLAQGERTVESLATETGLSVANTSRHLQQLRQAQLVLARRDGLFVHYRLAGPEVASLILALRHAGERHLAEVERVVRDFLGDRDGFEPVTPAELAQRMSNGEVIVLDVRPEREYAAGHIAGARSMPVDDIKARLPELPRDKEYVAYCRGPYCVFADEAVALLHANGLKAQRLSEGYPEWWLAGRPVQTLGR